MALALLPQQLDQNKSKPARTRTATFAAGDLAAPARLGSESRRPPPVMPNLLKLPTWAGDQFVHIVASGVGENSQPALESCP
jgi:hypothetical protein